MVVLESDLLLYALVYLQRNCKSANVDMLFDDLFFVLFGIIRNASEHSTISFKSRERQKLVDQGYKIVGNIGDQWSDILGPAEGDRTFKLPDPMYYVS